MTRLTISGVAVALLMAAAGPLWAQEMVVSDAYVRSSTPASVTAAAFLTLTNETGHDDVLIGAASDVAGMVMLHRHSEDANGVMRMGEIEGGVPLPAGAAHVFARGGDHLMLTGLTAPLEQGGEITVTLEFATAGKVAVQVPVDHERKPDHGAAKQ